MVQETDSKSFLRLRYYNLIMGTVHLVQGILVLALATDFSLPVTAYFLDGPPGTPQQIDTLFEINIAWAVALFVFLSAIAHYAVSLPGTFNWYKSNLLKNRNYARWIEYSISSSVMVVLIAMLPGITDVVALIGIFFVNAAMVMFGLLMEHYEEPGSPDWTTYIFGTIVGLVPWLGIGIYLWSPSTDASPPAFVYGIFVSIFIFFNSFAINMILQYKKVWKWKNYLFGESM
ncbi:MAG: hypothetical protein EGP10_03145, partial [SAR202 cluster bacterium]